MADYYDLSGMKNTTSMFGVTDSINTASGGIFSILFMLISFVVVLYLLRAYEFKVQLISALGFVFAESILLWGLGFIPLAYIFTVLGFVVICAIWVMWT
jgi:hypothetical protein